MRFIILLLIISSNAIAETPLSADDIRDIHCAGINKEIQSRNEAWMRFVDGRETAREQYKAARAEQPRDYEKIEKLKTELQSGREFSSKWMAKTRESLIFKYTVCSPR